MTDTKILRLHGPGIQQSTFRVISKLNNLLEVNLCSSDTDDLDAGILCQGLAHTLKVLNLSHTKVTDRGLIYVQKLCNLEELYLTNCTITDAGISHLYALR